MDSLALCSLSIVKMVCSQSALQIHSQQVNPLESVNFGYNFGYVEICGRYWVQQETRECTFKFIWSYQCHRLDQIPLLRQDKLIKKMEIMNELCKPPRPYSGSTMIQLHLSLPVCPLRSLQSSVFLAGSSLSYTGTKASSADSGPNFINYKPICCWQPLWRGLYPALASVQHKHSEGCRDGGRRKQGHLWLPPWVKHGAVQGNWWRRVEEVAGGVLKVHVSNKDAQSSNPTWSHPDGESMIGR